MENNINNTEAPQTQTGVQQTNGEGQVAPQVNAGQGVTAEDIVSTMLNESIANAVNNVAGAQQNNQQTTVDYGAQISGIEEKLGTMMEAITKLTSAENTSNSQNNENNVDTPVQNATINTNDNTFDVNEITKSVNDNLSEHLKTITAELNTMKVSSIKQAYGLNDSDFKFVSEVANKVGVDILNDQVGLQSIINTIENNNKVVIGKQRVQSQKSDTELQMQETSNYLRSITGGKL